GSGQGTVAADGNRPEAQLGRRELGPQRRLDLPGVGLRRPGPAPGVGLAGPAVPPGAGSGAPAPGRSLSPCRWPAPRSTRSARPAPWSAARRSSRTAHSGPRRALLPRTWSTSCDLLGVVVLAVGQADQAQDTGVDLSPAAFLVLPDQGGAVVAEVPGC